MCRARFLFSPSSPFLSSIHSEALILKMMLFFPTSCLSNEVLISGLQLSSQQGEDEVRRSWEKWRAREQCGGNNARLCSSGLLGNGGCTQLPGKITCPKTLGGDAQRKEAPCFREGGERYPSESGPPPMRLKCLPLVPVQAEGEEETQTGVTLSALWRGWIPFQCWQTEARGKTVLTQTPCCMPEFRGGGAGLGQATSTCNFTW